MKKIILCSISVADLFFACKTVPLTGRKQLNLVPDFMIREMALTQNDPVVRAALTPAQYASREQMVTRQGSRTFLAMDVSQ